MVRVRRSLVLEILLDLGCVIALLHVMARFATLVTAVAAAWLSFVPSLVDANTGMKHRLLFDTALHGLTE
jgi:hypothetical protein